MATWDDFGIEVPYGGHGQVRTICPKCTPTRKPGNQRRKDLSVNLGEQVFLCQHCGWSGTLKTGQETAPDWRRPPTPPAPFRKQTYSDPRPLPSVTIPTLWDKTVAWFETRGIPERTLLELGITASNEYCPVCEAEVGNVLFPFYVNGQHVNTKHRCGKKHFRMEKGAQRVLYNLDACADADEITIVEGEMDVLALHAAGITNVVSVPDGAPAINAGSYSSKFTFLEAAEDLFGRIKRVVIATDADAPGQKLMEELARRIGPEKCARVIWEDGIKDANECLIQAGPDYLRAMIETATPYPVEGIFTGNDLLPDLLDLYRNGEEQGAGFGQVQLDEHYRVRLGHMTVWTGIASHGKSTVLDQFMLWLSDKHDWRFALFSPEQQPLVLHQRDLIRQRVGKSFRKQDARAMTEAEVVEANAWVSDRFSFILPPENPSIDEILRLAKVEVFRRGIQGMVIDPWNELAHSRPHNMLETDYVSYALTQIRQFARNHNIHVWVCAHPTKMQPKDDGTERVPGLWDISGSANFRNKADVGVTIWRDLQNRSANTVEMHITKMRFDDSGKLGKVVFGYDLASKRLYEATHKEGAA